jgi:hypothetical protein
MRAIFAVSRGLEFSVADLVIAVELEIAREESSVLGDAIRGAVGSLNARSLGRWIADRESEIIGGLRFIRLSKGREGVSWKIESADSTGGT